MRHVATLLALAALATGLWWWQHPAPQEKKSAHVFPSHQTSLEEPAPIAEVEKAEPEPQPQAPATAVGDPQLDVHTAIMDLAGMMRASDYVGMVAKYVPPDELKRMSTDDITNLVAAASDPNSPQHQYMQSQIQALEIASKLEPTMNEAGDSATYSLDLNIPNVSKQNSRIVFVKIDGRWYRND
jgi:hypothetical protein